VTSYSSREQPIYVQQLMRASSTGFLVPSLHSLRYLITEIAITSLFEVQEAIP
jgi:hypothetical protein